MVDDVHRTWPARVSATPGRAVPDSGVGGDGGAATRQKSDNDRYKVRHGKRRAKWTDRRRIERVDCRWLSKEQARVMLYHNDEPIKMLDRGGRQAATA